MINLKNFSRRFGLYVQVARLLGFKNSARNFKRLLVRKLGRYPKAVAVEVSSWCNLNCAFCVTKDIKVWEHREKKFLTFVEFKKLVDDIEYFCGRINFACAGEPLMNPEIYDMFAYANQKGIFTSLFTNATFLTSQNIENLLNSPPTRIFTALESFDKVVYEKTKVGAKHDIVKSNIENLVAQKKKKGQKTPQIVLRMVVTKKNYQEIDNYVQLARAMGVDAAAMKPLGVWPQGNKAYKEYMFKELIVEHPMSRYKKDANGKFVRLPRNAPCISIDTPMVLSDGCVCLCWYDALKESMVGNVNKMNFVDIWKRTAKFRKKKMSQGHAFPICKECLGIGAAGKIINFS